MELTKLAQLTDHASRGQPSSHQSLEHTVVDALRPPLTAVALAGTITGTKTETCQQSTGNEKL